MTDFQMNVDRIVPLEGGHNFRDIGGYLATMFDTLEARHRSVAGFLRDELAVDEAMAEAIRERLLS